MKETLSKNQTNQTDQNNQNNKKEQATKPIFRIINKNKLKINPEESDLMGFRVGDCLIPIYGGLTIYEVLEINRLNSVDTDTLKRIEQMNTYNIYYTGSNQGKPSYRNEKLKRLLDWYRANNNSGACEIAMKCIFRGNKTIKKGKVVRYIEMTICPDLYGFKPMRKVDYDSLIKSQDDIRASCKDQITEINKRIAESLVIESKLKDLRDRKVNQETNQKDEETFNLLNYDIQNKN